MHLVSMVIADLIAIAALCTIYLIRHNRRELVVSYTIINFGVFVVTEALSFAAGTSAGMGLGLFGVLSIIRLRSTALAQREVAYYFVSLALGLIAGVRLDPEYMAYALMAMLVIIMAIVDLPFFDDKQKTQVITVDRAISDPEELKTYLNQKLSYEVLSAKISELDMVNDTTRAEVKYNPTPPVEDTTTGLGNTPNDVVTAKAQNIPIQQGVETAQNHNNHAQGYACSQQNRGYYLHQTSQNI